MNTYEFHEVSSVFPMMNDEEYTLLKEDIARNGLIEPVYVWQGKIIDGRHRYRACQELGIEPSYREWNGVGSLVEFVVSLNLKRRHLSSSQKSTVAIQIEPLLAEEARQRQQDAGGQYYGKSLREIFPEATSHNYGKASEHAARITGTNSHYVYDAKKIRDESPETFERVRTGELTIPQAKQEIARQRVPDPAITPPFPAGKYRCIVVDPPWPMVKIEREVAPNQGVSLDYPTMTLNEISELPIDSLASDDGCHLYLWVTQKYLPEGLRLVKAWGFDYQCLMTWVKPSGFTPYSWMYNTEHVIYAHRGGLRLQRLGLKLSFDAPTNGHSVKPDAFYERVIQASPEPRLEMFARQQREGFTVWGNEV